MTTLLFGKHGQVGFELQRLLDAPVVACDIEEVDLTSATAVRSLIAAVKPQVIINAAAYTAVDKAESEPRLALAINAEAPAVMAEEAKRLGALLVHYSTDYVYDGTSPTPHVEEELPHPLGVYAQSKLAGDEAILASGCRHLILRTSWIYGTRGHNFLLTMLKKQSEGAALRIVDDQIGAPTWSRELALATKMCLSRALADDISGLYHVAAQGFTSWFGFASKIFSEAELDAVISPIKTVDYPTPAGRPLNSILDQSKLKRDFDITMPAWDEALTRCLHELLAKSLSF